MAGIAGGFVRVRSSELMRNHLCCKHLRSVGPRQSDIATNADSHLPLSAGRACPMTETMQEIELQARTRVRRHRQDADRVAGIVAWTSSSTPPRGLSKGCPIRTHTCGTRSHPRGGERSLRPAGLPLLISDRVRSSDHRRRGSILRGSRGSVLRSLSGPRRCRFVREGRHLRGGSGKDGRMTMSTPGWKREPLAWGNGQSVIDVPQDLHDASVLRHRAACSTDHRPQQ